jgi:hypothetical protein
MGTELFIIQPKLMVGGTGVQPQIRRCFRAAEKLLGPDALAAGQIGQISAGDLTQRSNVPHYHVFTDRPPETESGPTRTPGAEECNSRRPRPYGQLSPLCEPARSMML